MKRFAVHKLRDRYFTPILYTTYNAQFAHDYRLLCFQMYFCTRTGTMEPTKSHKVALFNHSTIASEQIHWCEWARSYYYHGDRLLGEEGLADILLTPYPRPHYPSRLVLSERSHSHARRCLCGAYLQYRYECGDAFT